MPTSRAYTPKPETQARLVAKQANRIYPNDITRQEQFCKAVLTASAGKSSLIWLTSPEPGLERLTDWQPEWVTGTIANTGQDPRYASGDYYPLDFSSVISVSAILAIKEPVRTVLDLCAAPGGKGIFAWRAFHPELLVSNEVISKRAGMLISNLRRCKVAPSVVIKADPSQLAQSAKERFDLVLVDAPCSGQSLIAKGELAAGAFQPNLISANMTRQRRILANAASTVAPGGHLTYMTCTYSREENEKNVEWFLRRFPEYVAVEVEHLRSFRSSLADFPCYRHAPQDGVGVGGFTALLRNSAASRPVQPSLDGLYPIWKSS